MGCNCHFLEFMWLKVGHSLPILCKSFVWYTYSDKEWKQWTLKDLALHSGCGLCPREKDGKIFGNGLHWKIVHVANSGRDHDDCGEEDRPCKTIKYAIDNFRMNVNLRLHGGRDAIYDITSTINLNFSVSITNKHDNAIENPTLNCTTNVVFSLSKKVHFHLQSVSIVGNKDTLNVISLRCVSVGGISISNVNITMVNNNARVTMVLLALFQTAETITIASSSIQGQGIFVKISGASYICERSLHNVTIAYSTANTGIKIVGGQFNFDIILVAHSSFQNDTLYLQNSTSIIQSLRITDTTTSNGFTIKEPSNTFNNPDHVPRNILPKDALTEIAIVTRKDNMSNSSVSSFYAKNVNAKKNLLTIKDVSPLLIEIINISESECDYCLTADSSSIKVASIIVTNTTVKDEILSIHKGTFVLNGFTFINNKIQSHGKAISYQSYGTEGNIVLRNGLIDWNVQNSSKPFIDLKVVPGTSKIENLRIKTSSQREVKVLFLKKKLYDKQDATNISITCPNNSSVSSIIRSGGGEWFSIDLSCKPCDYGFYSLRYGSVAITTPITHHMENLKHQSTDATCKECPMGAICENGIRSGDNYYGYKVDDQNLTFIHCPTDYCCEMDECKNFTSCSKNRVGLLCGNCANGYQENYFNTGCIEVRKCKSFVSFWVLLLTTTSAIVIWFAFTKELKQVGSLLKIVLSKLASKLVTKEPSQEEDVEKCKKLTVSAVFNILVGFYQVKKLMSVKLSERYRTDGIDVLSYISDVFNLDFVIKSSESFCPVIGLNAILKGVLKNFVTPLIMLTYLLIALLLHGIYKVISRRHVYHFKSVLTWQQRIGLTYIKLLLFSYKNIATFCIVLVNCVDINDSSVLYIHADTLCFQRWQKLVMVFLGVWVIPFPGALMMSYRMLMARKISFQEFIASTMFPLITLRLYFTRKQRDTNYLKEHQQEQLFQNLKEFFEEPYRLINESDDSYVFWETWQLYQRLILAFVITFAVHPIIRAYATTIVVIISIVVLAYADPYKQEMYVLRLMEVTSLAGISMALSDAMFNSYVYTYQIQKHQVARPLKTLAILNVVVTPVYVLIYSYVVEPVLKKLSTFLNRMVERKKIIEV